MHFLYTLAVYLLSPLVLARLFILGIKTPAYRNRWSERFGFVKWTDSAKPTIWLHAVSVGEVNAATPLISKLLDEYSNFQILVTTVTPTGATTVRHHFADNVEHLYLPYDLPFSVNRFIKLIRPELLITMETEIWPNLYLACKQSKIPVLIINARLSQKSAKRYNWVAGLMRQTLSNVELIAAQTKADAKRFVSLGANENKVFVSGNLKFDINVPVSVSEQAQSLKRYFSVNRPIWIAASTQEGEEEIILQAHTKIIEKFKDAILILAPRHPERVTGVAGLCENYSFKYVKRTDQMDFSDNCQVYLLDTLGELQLHYSAAQVAFVGGSLVKRGGQNMIEPAGLGIPVIAGPHTYNFTEITELLVDQNALMQVANENELAQTVCNLLSDANLRHSIGEKGQTIININKGNIDRLMQLIRPYLSV